MNRQFHHRTSLGAAGLLAIVGSCSFASAQPARDVVAPVYYTSFESPAYLAGPLVEQDKWAVLSGMVMPDVAVVQNKVFATGSQAVCITPALLGLLNTEWMRPLNYQTTVTEPIIDIQGDLFLTQGPVNSTSWEFMVRGDALEPICSVSIQANAMDTVCYWAGGPTPAQSDASIKRNVWNNFRIRLDYAGGTAEFYLNGVYLNPAARSVGAPGLRAGDTLGSVGFGVIGPAKDVAFIDNISVTASEVVCAANCDGSWARPLLNANDFVCFMNEFSAALSLPPKLQLTSYANFDHSMAEPVLTANDFQSFLNAYAAGCP